MLVDLKAIIWKSLLKTKAEDLPVGTDSIAHSLIKTLLLAKICSF
jgi:hypothetical protein